MALYAVGDIQGCYDELAKLLDTVNFDQTKDRLFCVGDLVNRGPKSLKTLRFLRSLGDSCTAVLGNHDIHLLAMIYGIRSPKPNDTLIRILESEDCSETALWLRNLPLLAHDKDYKLLMCHAGIYPWWTAKQAKNYAREVERIFRDEEKCIKLLHKIYANKPSKWQDSLSKTQRRRFIINAFTRMRFCSPQGHLNLTESGYSGKVRKNRVPWFDIVNQSLNDYRLVFGHWSALGLMVTDKLISLDTGCVWGRTMTMAKIPRNKDDCLVLYSQPAQINND
ncbi:MAG: symmetrical bis(5'-nucleosyl)-tetraphosphatase [Gammaproteobacteria bacterium]|nr:symmetrical bis(5'-nucleosyl)-tetraphosphatase [Gammaproteobacteria bacterium]